MERNIALLIFSLFIPFLFYGTDINKGGYKYTYPKKFRVGFGASVNYNKYLNPKDIFYAYNGAIYQYPIKLDKVELTKGKSFELIACYNSPKKTDIYFGIGYMQKAFTISGYPMDKTSIPSYYQFDSISRRSQYTGVHIPFGIRYYYLSNDKNGAYLAAASLLEVAKLQKLYQETIVIDGKKLPLDPPLSKNERYPFLLLSASVGFDIHVFNGYQLNPEVYFNYPLQQNKNVNALASVGFRLILIQK